MPAILPNTPTANAYPTSNQSGGCQLGLNDVFETGYFVVANAAAFAQYQHGVQGQQDFSPDIFLPPATYPLVGSDKDPLGGIRFKSAVPGTPAQVFGVFYKKDESALLAGSEFAATVSSSGGITSGGTMITGRVNANGTIAAGTGFTVAWNGVSTYTITFTTPFAAIPVVLWQATAGSTQFALTTVTVSGFVAVTQGGAPSDFNFIAQAVS